MLSLMGLSSTKLRIIADRATMLAKELEGYEPGEEVALRHGITKKYSKTDYTGKVVSYSGDVVFTHNNREWKAIGHGHSGNAYSANSPGYIEFIPLFEY